MTSNDTWGIEIFMGLEPLSLCAHATKKQCDERNLCSCSLYATAALGLDVKE